MLMSTATMVSLGFFLASRSERRRQRSLERIRDRYGYHVVCSCTGTMYVDTFMDLWPLPSNYGQLR